MIVAIASGKGGTGKTSLAVNLARTLERIHAMPVQLLDCDVEEPNSHLFLAPAWTEERPRSVAVPVIAEDKCRGESCRRCVDRCSPARVDSSAAQIGNSRRVMTRESGCRSGRAAR
mgnify:CR=1 FL=1